MDVDDAFLARLASELARLRLEVATLQTYLAPRTGGGLESIHQATELSVQSPLFQDEAQRIFARLQESHSDTYKGVLSRLASKIFRRRRE